MTRCANLMLQLSAESANADLRMVLLLLWPFAYPNPLSRSFRRRMLCAPYADLCSGTRAGSFQQAPIACAKLPFVAHVGAAVRRGCANLSAAHPHSTRHSNHLSRRG